VFVADAGKEIVGEQDVSVGLGLFGLTLGFGVEHDLHPAAVVSPPCSDSAVDTCFPLEELAPTARV
jgi:hypothetical protein